ncbi:EFR1 family ferrodoxin [Clostridioides difficile]|nr:EFR1 family ferrodoxin [Clostridioides difficile]
MNKLCIFYFSGTGMTEYIINKLKQELESQQFCVECIKIENIKKSKIHLTSYDMVGVAYPVHSFNAPQIVLDFVKILPNTHSMDTFIIHTAGEDNYVNYASSNLLIKRLDAKGFKVFYNKLFAMPSNFMVKYDDTKTRELIDKADKEITNTVHNLINRISYLPNSSTLVKTLSFIGRSEWYGAHILGKFFYVKKNCIHCSKCASNCPKHNINVTKYKVKFNWSCCLCMRCIYNCPEDAIGIHQPFKFIRLDKWYDSNLFTKK